jgi:group I intron endonuclease
MFEDSGEIYIITNKINKKKYIGQAVCYLSNGRNWGSHKRWLKHIYQAITNKCECRALENAIRKYGQQSFDVNVLIECGIHELNQLEDEYINEYNTLTPNGYNLMTGGSNGRRHCLETRQKMTNTRIGKIHKQSTKDKIGQKHTGKIVSKQTIQKISSSSKYRNIKPEHKQTIEIILRTKHLENLPMYIYYIINRQSDGFYVRIPKHKSKKFTSKSFTLLEKFNLAYIYKQSILSNQRMSV